MPNVPLTIFMLSLWLACIFQVRLTFVKEERENNRVLHTWLDRQAVK